MPMRSTFEISTQKILLKIDGFLKGWILNITPLKYLIEYVSNQPGSKNCQNKKVQAKRLDIPGYL